jgi:hypothetical protein
MHLSAPHSKQCKGVGSLLLKNIAIKTKQIFYFHSTKKFLKFFTFRKHWLSSLLYRYFLERLSKMFFFLSVFLFVK